MRLGYNTNGFAHHRLRDTLIILAELGYESVAITLDYHALNPFDTQCWSQLSRISRLLYKLRLRCVVETGARFLLDPRHKHQPTLLSSDASERERRRDFLRRAIELSVGLDFEPIVSFWSGAPDGRGSDADLMTLLVEECTQLCDYAATKKVRLAFEPEPGMFIDTMSKFEELHRRVNHPAFGLTLDIGHLHCQNELPIAYHIHRWKDWLWNVHIEDMKQGVHHHLMFGEGEIDFPPVFRALREIDYRGGVHVELSRHSHDAVNTATRAMGFLRQAQCDA